MVEKVVGVSNVEGKGGRDVLNKVEWYKSKRRM